MNILAPETDEYNKAVFIQEVILLNAFSKHPYFPQLVGYNELNLTLLIKYYSLGSLRNYLQRTPANPWTKRSVLTIFLDICKGVEVLHNTNVAHCDLKLDNILLEYVSSSSRLCAVIIDFGIARILTSSEDLKVKHLRFKKIRGVSIPYAPPELLHILGLHGGQQLADKRSVQTIKAGDVYSLSCILYSEITKHLPWF